MIVRSHRQHSCYLLWTLKGSIVPSITPIVLLSVAWACFATWMHQADFEGVNEATSYAFAPFTALGVAISLFLGFHNNASYERWWEARKIWGKHIIDNRNLLRFVLYSGAFPGMKHSRNSTDSTNVRDNSSSSSLQQQQPTSREESVIVLDERTASSISTVEQDIENVERDAHGMALIDGGNWRHEIVALAIAHTHALRHQLREGGCVRDIVPALDDRDRFLRPSQIAQLKNAVNPAHTILCWASQLVGQQKMDAYTRIHVMRLIDTLCDNQTACERIHNTSMPFAYTLLVHRTAFLYVVFLPWALAGGMGWWTPVFTAILCYTFFGLDELSRQIQEPFGDEINALALTAMSFTIERDVCQALNLPVPAAKLPGPDMVLM